MAKLTLQQRDLFGACLMNMEGTGRLVTVTLKTGEIITGKVIGYTRGYEIKKPEGNVSTPASALISATEGQWRIEVEEVVEIETEP